MGITVSNLNKKHRINERLVGEIARSILKVIKKEDVKGVTFSTHVLPLSVMVDYLANSFKFETIVIGIEPKDMAFGHAVSKEIKMAVDMVGEVIFDFAKELV